MTKTPIFLVHPGEAIALARYFQPYSATSIKDDNDTWIVGYGHRQGVGPSASIHRNKAEELLDLDLDRAREVVLMAITVEIEQHEFEALLDFALTLDARQFLFSGLPKAVNAHDHENAIAILTDFPDYAGGRSDALIKRRAAQAALYKSGSLPLAIAK